MSANTGHATGASLVHAQNKIASPSPELAQAIEKGYEPHDIALRGVFVFLVTLTITIIVVIIAMYGVLQAFIAHDRNSDPIGSPTQVTRNAVATPLQPSVDHDYHDYEDMQAMREQTHRLLSESGTTPSGRQHISIESAMAQASQIPTKPPQAPEANAQNTGGADR